VTAVFRAADDDHRLAVLEEISVARCAVAHAPAVELLGALRAQRSAAHAVATSSPREI